MNRADIKLGLALSGGGYRALVFHLGAIKALAEENLFSNIDTISTVSGGSLVPLMVLKNSNMRWPDEEAFIQNVLPLIREEIISHPLTLRLILCGILNAKHHVCENGAKVLSLALEKTFGVKETLQDLPDRPRWVINATSYQTGKNWRFEKAEMGDWVAGHVIKPELKICDAVAASCGFPGLIGSLRLDVADFKWVETRYDQSPKRVSYTPSHKHIHLWDAALYENLGSEAVYKADKGFRDGMNAMIVVDASYSEKLFLSRLPWNFGRRLMDITLRAIQNLRTRLIWRNINQDPSSIAYIKIGRTLSQIAKDYKLNATELTDIEFMDDDEVVSIASYRTDLSKMSKENYDKLFEHGYQVAKLSISRLFSGT